MAIMVLVAILFWGSLLVWAYSVNKPQQWEDNTKYPKRYSINNQLYVKLLDYLGLDIEFFKLQSKCNSLSKELIQYKEYFKNFPKISNCMSSKRVHEIASQNYLMAAEWPVINITGPLVKIVHRQCNSIVAYIGKNEDSQYHVELEINPNDSALVDYLSKVFPGTEVTVTGKFYDFDFVFGAKFLSVKVDEVERGKQQTW